MAYSKLSVKKYQQLNKIPPPITDGDPIDIELSKNEFNIARLAIITGKSADELEAEPFRRLKHLMRKLRFLDENKHPGKQHRIIWLNGTRYVLRSELKDYSKGIYLTLKAYGNDVIGNMHHILAWLYQPTFGKHDPDKAANDFLKAKMSKVYGTFFLFSRMLQRSKVLLAYSRLEAETKIQNHKQVMIQYFSGTDGIESLTSASKLRQA